jgi:hypothetical protein
MQINMQGHRCFCEKKMQKTQKQAKKKPFVVEKCVETVDNCMHKPCGKLEIEQGNAHCGACATLQNCF